MNEKYYYNNGNVFMDVQREGDTMEALVFRDDGTPYESSVTGPDKHVYTRFYRNGAKNVWTENKVENSWLREKYNGCGQLLSICSYDSTGVKKHGDERSWVDGKEYLKRWKNGRLVG